MSVAVQVPQANGVPNANANGNGHAANDDVLMNGTSTPTEAQARFATGLILPPPDIKSIIDRTATFVARSANPAQFEDKVRENQRSDPKFSFLNPNDPYHAYYREKMLRVEQGEEEPAAAGNLTPSQEMPVAKVDGESVSATGKGKVTPLEPPPAEFIGDTPHISAQAIDTIKLTALFTARRGRTFLQTLALKEARNYEFEFLNPTHSLFGYFNGLVEQYSKVLFPPKETLEKLERGSEEGARWKMLEVSRQHAEWERLKRDKEKRKHDDKEAERIAFAEIDWHDYTIVQTIEFTSVDATSELPPPMGMQEMISRTMAQKKMAAMIMEDTADEVEAVRARQAAEQVASEAAAANGGDENMATSDDEDADGDRLKKEEQERMAEMERAKAIQASFADAPVNMKIRTDYVPKLGNKANKVTTTTCRICGLQVPVDELQEHMRIELLDPKWKSQRDMLEARKAQANELQSGANVESSLRSLAKARVDIFGTEVDEEKRKQEELAEQERRKEREKNVWDGHTASKDRTLSNYQSSTNFDEQIANIHRQKGLTAADPASGPGIGPSSGPGVPSLPAPPPSLPAPPRAISDSTFAAATVSAAPQPASMYANQNQSATPPVMLPPLHFQGLDAAQTFGYQPPPPPHPGTSGMHPARMAALGTAGPGGPQAGMVRSADQMEGVEGPPAKKVKIARLPGGQYYPEETWIEMHPQPISIQIQLPIDETKPEWKLNGSVVTLPEIPVTYLVSTLRDTVVRHMGSSVPLSRIVLHFEGKMLANANTLALYNVEDEDMLVLSLRDAKKKK